MENSIKVYYDGLSTSIFLFSKEKFIWHNKFGEKLAKNKKLVKKILENGFSSQECKKILMVDKKSYEILIRPFKEYFFVEICEECLKSLKLIQNYYETLKTPVFLCSGNNLIWHNSSAMEFVSNLKLKNNILSFKDCTQEQRQTFICGDFFYKVFVRPFGEFFYVEIIEKLPVGFKSKKEICFYSENDILESEILDNITRSVVHDVSQALSQISEILEKNNNFAGLEFVDIILKRIYSLMRATNLSYEYELLLQGKDNMNAEIVDIFVEIDALCSAVKSLMRKSQVKFEWQVPNEKIFCDIDMHKLGFVLFHLICNSYRFCQPTGLIKLVANMDENNNINIEISDNGIGIPKNMLDKVLKPFFSYDRTSGDIAGVGLGLTYVGLFADRVNGKFKIESTKEGTKFLLSIPIVSLSDVMGLSSHIVKYNESRYDSMVTTLVGTLRE